MKENYDDAAKELFDSLLAKSFEKTVTDEETKAFYAPPLEGIEAEAFPLLEEEDREILMHRDAHFGKNFAIMSEHYQDEGIGACLDIDPDRITFLMQLEESIGANLAPYLLQGSDAEKVARSIALYKVLREQVANKKNVPLVAAISELILSEEENDQAAGVVVSLGDKVIPYLIQLLQTPTLFDPLFPGYGLAPARACLALGKLKATEAIPFLFGMIGEDDFDTESASLQALSLMQEQVTPFVLTQLASRPLTKNNERAAILCSSLVTSDMLTEAILKELEDPEVQQNESLTTYLVLACTDIPEKLRSRFTQICGKISEGAREELERTLNSC